jgi:Mn-dependent DtxR family transcriptional regulator
LNRLERADMVEKDLGISFEGMVRDLPHEELVKRLVAYHEDTKEMANRLMRAESRAEHFLDKILEITGLVTCRVEGDASKDLIALRAAVAEVAIRSVPSPK